jgi:hypothetical protein
MADILTNIMNYLTLFYEHLKTQKWSIFMIFIFVIVFYFIYGLLTMINFKEDIKKNWSIYKTNPFMLPIAGFFMEGSVITNTFRNFQDFIYNSTKNAFSLLIRPIHYMFSIITKSLGDMIYTVNNMRKMAKVTRELFQKMIGEVFEQITRSVSTLQFYQEKFKNLMKKQYAIFQIVYYYLETLRATFDSMFNGPLPVMLLFLMLFGILSMFIMSMCLLCPVPIVNLFACPICILCFDSDTMININENEQKKIEEIQLGDRIYPDQTIIGTFVFELSVPMFVYKLGNAYATASHIFYNDDGYPQRIDEISEHLERKSTNKLYCLATTKNLLFSGDQMFADYYEISTQELDNLWNSNVMSSLNNGTPEINVFTNYPTGFLESVPIQCENITGRIEHLINESNVELFTYNGIICSGNNIVFESNRWIRVHNSSISNKYTGSHTNKLIHYTSHSGIVSINDTIFRDFLETDSNSVYDWWNKTSLEYINKSIC